MLLNNNNQKEEKMKDAPKSVLITSKNKLLIQAMWEDLNKLGYTRPNNNTEPNWNAICHNRKISSDENDYKSLWVSEGIGEQFNRDLTFNLPEDYTKCLEYMTEALKYWEPKYQVGDWVTLVANALKDGGGNNGTYRIGDTFKITDTVKSQYPKIGYWLQNSRSGDVSENIVRKATPEEIENAQTKIILIGSNHIKVAVKPSGIMVEGRTVKVQEIQEIINHMLTVVTRPIGIWSVKLSPRAAKIGCCENITVEELKSVVDAYNKLTK